MNTKQIFLIFTTLLLFYFSLLLTNIEFKDVCLAFWEHSLGSKESISEILSICTPLLICSIAIFIGFQASLFNIGCEGQLAVGAIVAVQSGIYWYDYIGIIGCLMLSLIAGAIVAFPAAWIKAKKDGHEVISTIIMNTVVMYLSMALISGPLRAKGQMELLTEVLPFHRMIPMLDIRGVMISSANFYLIILVVLSWLILKRSAWGFESRVMGKNMIAAEYAGINVPRMTQRVLLFSGAIAGIAGGITVFAYEGCYFPEFSHHHGYTAIGIALLAGHNIIYLIPSTFVFAMLMKGSEGVISLGAPESYNQILLAGLILLVAMIRYRRSLNA